VTDPERRYREAVARHDGAREKARRASVRLATLRAVTFVAAGGAFLGWDVLDGGAATTALAAGVVLVGVFLVEISVHRRHRRRERWHAALLALAREGLHRMDRRWTELTASLPGRERAVEPPPADHPYARDLDLVGEVSLLRLLGPVTSSRGRALLLEWLLAPAPPGEVRARQGAVAELAPLLSLRSEFAAHGRLDAAEEPGTLEPFLEWAESPSWLGGRPLLVWAARTLPPVLVTLVLGDVFLGWAPWWILPGLAQLVVLRRTASRLSSELSAAASGGPALVGMVPQIELLEAGGFEAERLRALGARLREEGENASAALARLSRLLDTVESRRNLVWAAVAPILLLDVHLAGRLDRWRRVHGASVRRWIDVLAEWEALAALATLAHDHPGWTVPEVVEATGPMGGDEAGWDAAAGEEGERGGGRPVAHRRPDGPPAGVVLSAEALGHPLLRPDECVRNDVTVGPPGSFLLVTGSNMSGKSTLLRALGSNVVLAQAGAPVCAGSFRLPALRVHTSMRIDDSLARGVSLFMAELLRVRDIVRAADSEGPPVFYLLDEILHGTNTAERRVAARGVIRHLLEAGAIGAVSTHDLTLARAPDLEAAAEAVHFREEVEEVRDGEEAPATRLHFDYTLRPGIATTRNALKLLEAVGLGGLELEEEGREGEDGGVGPAHR
jgi:hypothetical protein